MNYLPTSASTERGSPEDEALVSQILEKAGTTKHSTEATNIFAALRERLANKTNPPEDIFQAIAYAAQILTGAHGIAIALRTNGVVVCRARSGDIAPPLGYALNVESGISGECFRTSETLHCDDADTDSRVEPEVCRSLGIRSIVVVPLRGAEETVGILEAFSSDAFAFSGEQIAYLEKLGGFAQEAHQQESAASTLLPVVGSVANVGPFATEDLSLVGSNVALAATSGDERISLIALNDTLPKVDHHYWILGGAVAMMLLASAIVWWTWHGTSAENTASQSNAQVQNAPTETASAAAAPKTFPLKPSPRIADQTTDKSRTKDVLRNAAKVEATGDADTSHPANDVARNISPANNSAESPLRSAASSAAVEPPMVVLGTSDNVGKLENIASASVRMPELDVKVSQGVTEANVTRKVEPVYPREALAKHLGGTVKLEAFIGDDGSVNDVKLLQGEATLAAAAITAVRQWRYSPCLLDGKPIAIQKEITVIFKAPLKTSP
jgi:TonB family protein